MALTFSERLTQLIDERGRGASIALANACSLERGYISQLKSGAKTKPSPLVVRAISDFFGVNPAWLLTGKGPKRPGEVNYQVYTVKPTGESMVIKDEVSSGEDDPPNEECLLMLPQNTNQRLNMLAKRTGIPADDLAQIAIEKYVNSLLPLEAKS
jgi:transcriptional regulator with XRE-family HTH domain